jgi:hypothetical protein
MAGWTLVCCTINTAAIGDLVSSIRWIAIAHRSNTAACLNPLLSQVHNDRLCAGYGPLVIPTRNFREESILALRADAISDTSISSASPCLTSHLQLRLARSHLVYLLHFANRPLSHALPRFVLPPCHMRLRLARLPCHMRLCLARLYLPHPWHTRVAHRLLSQFLLRIARPRSLLAR